MVHIRSPETLVLGFTMFVMGCCGLAYEYTYSKIATDLLGNSSHQWAMIIGIMLFFMGIGADLQKHLNDRGLFDKLIISELALGLCGGFGPLLMLYAYGAWPSHYVLVQYFFITAVGLLIGFEIPLLTRINHAYARDLRCNLANILKMDYVGSLCGALLWIFFLPKLFTIIEGAFILALLTLGTAGFGLWYFRRLVQAPCLLTCAWVGCILLVAYAFTRAESWTLYAEQHLYRDRIVLSHTTPYQHIVVTKSISGDQSCYINGQLQFNSTDEFIYHEQLVHPAMTIAPRRNTVLILGGGDGLALREVLKYPDVESVTLVDLDPYMTTLAKHDPYFRAMNENSLSHARLCIIENHALIPAGEEPIVATSRKIDHQGASDEIACVQLINIDAVKFIEQVPGRYDVIILDFPDPNTMQLAKLYARHFYELLARRLSADGILVQQSTSPIHAKEAFLCIGRTLQSAGLEVAPYHDNVPSFGEWGWWIGGLRTHHTRESLRTALSDTEAIQVPTRYLTSELIRVALVFGKRQLESVHHDITTLTTSRVYEYYLKGWRDGA